MSIDVFTLKIRHSGNEDRVFASLFHAGCVKKILEFFETEYEEFVSITNPSIVIDMDFDVEVVEQDRLKKINLLKGVELFDDYLFQNDIGYFEIQMHRLETPSYYVSAS